MALIIDPIIIFSFRISESSDSSGQGGASSEYESSKTSADEACASPEDAAKKQGGQHKWVSRNFKISFFI